ncbi:MAG: hypothetical protein ACR2II_11265 [Chthoniobacterales bacterium]
MIVTVTITGEDSCDLEIQTACDKQLTKLPGRKLAKASAITSRAIFNRDAEDRRLSIRFKSRGKTSSRNFFHLPLPF